MLRKLDTNKKRVRFLEGLQRIYIYSFPCHVCDYETGRKRELEVHLMSSHQITASFTHPIPERSRFRVAKRAASALEVDSVSEVYMEHKIILFPAHICPRRCGFV